MQMLKIIFRPHRTSLAAGMTEAQKVFAMLKVIPEAEIARARPPVAFALVIDTSGSMREFADQERAQEEIAARGLEGQRNVTDGSTYQGFNLPHATKLDQAIAAAHQLVDDPRLLPGDRATIIHFDTEAAVLLPLTPLSDKQKIHQAITSLEEHSGQTFMAKGMSCAQQQLLNLPVEIAKRVVLLTDGATQAEGQCKKLAGQLAECNTPIVAIGIGPEYKEDLMRELAELSQGRPYHLQSMSQLQEILEAEVGSTVREVVTDLQATLATVKGVTLNSFSRVYPSLSETEVTSQPYRLGNISAGDFTVFIAEFTVAGLARPASRVRIAQMTLEGSAPGLGTRSGFPPQDMYVAFTSDEAAIASVDAEVLTYVQQKNVDRLIQQAVGQATVNAGQARQTLQVAIGMTQRIGNAAMTQVLNNAMNELNQTGTISAGTRKTVVLGGKTKTVKAGDALPMGDVPSDEEIRKLSGL